ncbi:sensor histidine kinase [Arthrobacter sp. JSM 101049]|uniref:sensor histidine kinase n=1 Tax=Arthrobacter sp. JSM 101049 TaxID=929097 RepID=UPI0035661A92
MAVHQWSIRSRVLAGMLALVGLALVLAGTAIYAVERGELNERLDDSLSRSVQEFRVLAGTGLDPSTRRPYAHAEELLYTAMQRTLPSGNQGMIGLTARRLQWTAPDTVRLRLEADPGFLAWATSPDRADEARIETVGTAVTTYRAVVVPVQLSSDPEPGRFVLAYDYAAELRRINQNFAVFSAVGVLVMLVAAGAAWLFVERMLRPVRLLRNTAQQISETDLSRRIDVSGTDEFAELTTTINAMLDRLEGAVEAQRKLLDDVGHELRTPVTIVRGHLEVMDGTDPDDVDQAREISLDELGRMSLLINDLVTLATSNRADFVVPRPTDVGVLLDDILDKATALGDRSWRIGHRVEARVWLDPSRVTQAMLQLCANAVKFSSPGSDILLGSQLLAAQSDDEGVRRVLRLWVKDAGSGIDEADQLRIFDRFGRGRNSSRAEGSGLGLSIVSAISAAHGGRVSVDSAPGAGSIFRIDIPVTGGDGHT